MITKITESNEALYKKLFEEASESIADSLAGAKITTLDQYFQKISDLVKKDDAYYILPLDEPTFDIDANTRTITVPTSFKNNGISVKGDVISEILFFTVDRYYDSVDLAQQNIIIEWESAASGNSAGKSGYSKAVLKNTKLLSADNKLLFGWALSEDITENAGTVKFAVRFYSYDTDNKLTFSLSTISASAIIASSFAYEFTKADGSAEWNTTFKEEQDYDKIIARLKNSPIEDVDASGLVDATWVEGAKLEDLLEDGATTLDLGADGTVLLKTEGYVSEGSVDYNWIYKTLNDSTTDITLWTNYEYIETEDTVAKAGKDYYKVITAEEDEEKAGEYKLAGLTIGDAIDNTTLPIYEKFSTYNVSTEGGKSVTGTYTVTISNIVGFAKKENETPSTIIIPGPGTLTVEEPITQVILGEDGTATISVEAEANTGDTINYDWYLTGNIEDSIAKASDQDENERTISLGTEDEATFEKNITVSVTASRNGDTTDAITKEYRVTAKAHAPKSVAGTTTNGKVSISNEQVLVNVNTEDMLSDSLSYAWYEETNETDGNQTDDAPAIKTGVINPNASNVTPITIDMTDLQLGKTYYCSVKNVVNGSESEAVASNYITITG